MSEYRCIVCGKDLREAPDGSLYCDNKGSRNERGCKLWQLWLHPTQAEALDKKRQQLDLANLKAVRAEALQEKAEREAECWEMNFNLTIDKACAEIEEMERKRDKWRKRAKKRR